MTVVLDGAVEAAYEICDPARLRQGVGCGIEDTATGRTRRFGVLFMRSPNPALRGGIGRGPSVLSQTEIIILS